MGVDQYVGVNRDTRSRIVARQMMSLSVRPGVGGQGVRESPRPCRQLRSGMDVAFRTRLFREDQPETLFILRSRTVDGWVSRACKLCSNQQLVMRLSRVVFIVYMDYRHIAEMMG